MPGIVIVGAQWGDEGKGKVVDLFSESAELVVRYAGGPNAGHTLVVGGKKMVLRLIPSGVLWPTTVCVMSQGMVIDPTVLVGEIEALEQAGHKLVGRLLLSSRAHVIMPYHPVLDGLREAAAGDGKIGTTKRGIGPCYEDKAARRGIRIGDLRSPKELGNRVDEALRAWAPVAAALGGTLPGRAEILATMTKATERLVPFIADAGKPVDAALRAKKRVLFEGAQGTLLDIDHGTYPYVTSSSAIAGGACVGAGVGPTRIQRVVGISKGYTTRVGGGPFPTELHDATGEHLRRVGAEFGSVTGRPRRTGWLDIPALREAARVSGIDAWALTKVDVLTGLDEVALCVAYDTPHGRTEDFPLEELDSAKPVYEMMPGWNAPLSQARKVEDLPAAARRYIERIEELTQVPADLVSVGPDRAETIVRRAPF